MEEKTPELSEREQEILRLIATGASNKEIAHKLVISPNTVKVHVRNIFGKIGAASRTEAAMYAVREGILPDNSSGLLNETNDTGKLVVVGENAITSPLENGVFAQNKTIDPDGAAGYPRPDARTISRRIIYLISFLGVIILLFSIIPTLVNNDIPTGQNPNGVSGEVQWEVLAPMRDQRKDFAAAVFNEQLFIIGGIIDGKTTGQVESYNTLVNQWRITTPKPTPVSEVSAGVIGGKILIPGGKLSNGLYTDIFESYDPIQDKWEVLSPLPSPVGGYSLVVFDGKLILFGGWNGIEYFDHVFVYDPATDEWSQKTDMPTPRAFSKASAAYGNIFVIGGINQGKTVTVNEVYSPYLDGPGNEAWSVKASLPTELLSLDVINVAETIRVIGQQEDGSLVHILFSAEEETWEIFDLPEIPLIKDYRAVIQSSFLYLIGNEANVQGKALTFRYKILYTVSIPLIQQ